MTFKKLFLLSLSGTALSFILSFGFSKALTNNEGLAYPLNIFDSYAKKSRDPGRKVVKSIPIKAIKKVFFKATDTNLIVQQHDGTEIVIAYMVTEYAEKNSDVVIEEGIEGLDVLVNKKDSFQISKNGIHFSEQLRAFNILVPKQIEVIDAKTVSGNIDFINVKSQKLKINTVSGRIDLDIQSKNVNINSVSGDIKINEHSIEPDIEIKSVSGDAQVFLSQKVYANVSFKSVSGKLTNDLGSSDNSSNNLNKKGIIKFNSTSGDLEIRDK